MYMPNTPDLKQIADDIGRLRQMVEGMDNRLRKLERAGETRVNATATGAPPYMRLAQEPAHAAKTTASGETQGKHRVEGMITGKTFVVIGVVSLLFGLAFFFKYLFENNIIGVNGRIILGVVLGIAFLALGQFLAGKKAYRTYSFFITGGGLAILYLSIYSAFNFYSLISQTTAFFFMILVTAAGIAIALISDARAVAAVALLGGFLTPFLVSSEVDRQFSLFSYVLILNISFVVLSYFKKWHLVYILNFVGTYAVYGAWHGRFYEPEKLPITMLFLSLFFACFLVAPFLVSVARKHVYGVVDAIISTVNAIVYFSVSYALLKPDFESTLGFFFVLGALVYVVGAYCIAHFHKEDKNALFTLAGVGLVLLTLAVPIQFIGVWITIAWALEAALLLWLGFVLKSYYVRVFSLLIFVTTLCRLFAFDVSTKVDDMYTPILNERFGVYLFAIVAFFVGAYLYHYYKPILRPEERWLSAGLGVIAHFLALFILSAEIMTWYGKKIDDVYQTLRPEPLLQGSQRPGGPVPYGRQPRLDEYPLEGLKNTRNVLLSLLWVLYAAALMIIGFMRHSRAARIFALILFGVVILKVFLFDVSFLSDLYRIVSFVVLGVILLVVSFLFYHYKDKVKALLF